MGGEARSGEKGNELKNSMAGLEKVKLAACEGVKEREWTKHGGIRV